MSNDFYSSKSNELDFKQICLGHYKRILEISTHEFTGGYFNFTTSGTITNKTYVPDARSEFCQAVELLSLSLFPHFDSIMTKDYNSYNESLKDLKKNYCDPEGFITSQDKSSKYSIKLLEISKQLFQDLSCLMQRKDYFKGTSYSESTEIIDVDEREGGENDNS